MELTKSKFDEIYEKYKFWIDNPEMAFDFVHDVLAAEADFINEEKPQWYAYARKLDQAAYEVFSMSSQISNECFDGQY